MILMVLWYRSFIFWIAHFSAVLGYVTDINLQNFINFYRVQLTC
jgi:hypothetical protein